MRNFSPLTRFLTLDPIYISQSWSEVLSFKFRLKFLFRISFSLLQIISSELPFEVKAKTPPQTLRGIKITIDKIHLNSLIFVHLFANCLLWIYLWNDILAGIGSNLMELCQSYKIEIMLQTQSGN